MSRLDEDFSLEWLRGGRWSSWRDEDRSLERLRGRLRVSQLDEDLSGERSLPLPGAACCKVSCCPTIFFPAKGDAWSGFSKESG